MQYGGLTWVGLDGSKFLGATDHDERGRFTGPGGGGGKPSLAPSKEYPGKLRQELRSSKPVNKMSYAESDLAFRSEDPLTFAMAEHMEKTAGRDAMLKGLEAQSQWNTNPETDGKDWHAAMKMGANSSVTGTVKSSMKEQSLSDAEFRAIQARTEFTQEWARQTHGEEFTVYRGVKGKFAKELGEGETDMPVRGLTSFTTSRAAAREFAGKSGRIVETKVRADEVFISNELGAKGITRFSDDRGELVILSKDSARKVRTSS